MSVEVFDNGGPGRFATRRGGLHADEIAFIQARAFEGRTARQIAKMLGRPLDDVSPHVDVNAWEPPAPAEPEPINTVALPEPVPGPGEIVLSLWRGLLVVPSRTATRQEIAQEVARRYGVSLEALRGPLRTKAFTVPRQEAMWRMVKANRWSTPQIGDYFGGRDHTTVLHACKAHEKRTAAAYAISEAA